MVEIQNSLYKRADTDRKEEMGPTLGELSACQRKLKEHDNGDLAQYGKYVSGQQALELRNNSSKKFGAYI